MKSDDVLVGVEVENELNKYLLVGADTVGAEPRTVQEGLQSSQASSWKEAINAENDSLLKNMFSLADLPEGRNVIDAKWALNIKRNSDGSLLRYKVRLVAKGFSQQSGVDFTDIISPVARYTSIHILLAIANRGYLYETVFRTCEGMKRTSCIQIGERIVWL